MYSAGESWVDHRVLVVTAAERVRLRATGWRGAGRLLRYPSPPTFPGTRWCQSRKEHYICQVTCSGVSKNKLENFTRLSMTLTYFQKEVEITTFKNFSVISLNLDQPMSRCVLTASAL